MTEPIKADFGGVDVVLDASHPSPVRFVILEFETAKGSLSIRIPVEGAAQLAARLADLPFEHGRHRPGD
jgi:hypothetical protein